MSDAPLILASASPRRRELLAAMGVRFDVMPARLSEPQHDSPGVAPRAWAMALAYFKACCVSEDRPARWVLGADTIVVCRDRVLGKPRDAPDAAAMLALQAGCWSEVVTGVALVRHGPATDRLIACGVTRVRMRRDAAAIAEYVESGDWHGKAGAYGIQNAGDRLVESIDGSFTNVVGLPTELLARMFAERRCRGAAG